MSPYQPIIDALIGTKYQALRLAQPGFAWHVETAIRMYQGWGA